MKRLAIILVGFLLAAKCMAATHYVVPPGTAGATATDPYTNWATAGTNLIDVVNAAITNTESRLVWVTNGVYYPTNMINIPGHLTLQSVNGRDVTILDGSYSTNKCLEFNWLGDFGCVFNGFTVRNYSYINTASGTIHGGGIQVYNCLFDSNTNLNNAGGAVFIDLTGGKITNCIFRNNYGSTGGAIYESLHPGYAGYTTRILDCRFENNRAASGGACWFYACNHVISNCVFISNSASADSGGIYFRESNTNSLIANCAFTGNVAATYAGGIYALGQQTTIRNCSIVGNIAANSGGGFYGTNMTIRNCLIARNQATANIGGGIWANNSTMESCTIVSNYAKVAGGGVYINGSGSSGTNSVIYFNTTTNTDTSAANFTNTAGNSGLNYSCVIPAVAGTGNITNNPVLKDLAGGDYRLRMTSPCINTGTNQSWMTNAVDLDGNARIRYGIVDMGAYETRIWQGTIFSIPGR